MSTKIARGCESRPIGGVGNLAYRVVWVVFCATVLGTAGCSAGIIFLQGPGSSTAVGGATGGDIRFGVAGASADDIALVVPAGRQAEPYEWDHVPYRDSRIQVLRTCEYYTDVLAVPPVTEQRWWCWDRKRGNLMTFAAASDFQNVVRRHPDWIWIIGNEPDAQEQDNLTPEEYAGFFGYVAMVVANAMRESGPTGIPRLVYCQVSSPGQKHYCDEAYYSLKRLMGTGHWGARSKGLRTADMIYAVSVHNYVATDRTCRGEAESCYGSRLEHERLSDTVENWKRAMKEFERWVTTIDDGSLSEKPLWLTEFGALWARCPRRLEVRIGIDSEGGQACPVGAESDHQGLEEDYVFYGRNAHEGLWGAQREMLSFLLNPNGNSNANQGKWSAAWWFPARTDWKEGNRCHMTGWLFGDDRSCLDNIENLSRAGVTFRGTINCLVTKEDCPTILGRPRSGEE